MVEVLSIELTCTHTHSITPSVVSINCSVIDTNGQSIDSLSLKGYNPDETPFEREGCVQAYWGTRLPELLALSIDERLDHDTIQTNMMIELHAFLGKHKSAVICTTNEYFHISILKIMCEKYLPKTVPVDLKKIHDVYSLGKFIELDPKSNSKLGIAHKMLSIINR